MAIETPVKGNWYAIDVRPGCSGEFRIHGIAPVINGMLVWYRGSAPGTDGVHTLWCSDGTTSKRYYLAPSELKEMEATNATE